MPEGERRVGGMLAIRDSKIARFSMREIMDKLEAAVEIAGMSVLTLWPHYAKEVNDAVVSHCRKLGVKLLLWYPVLADNDIVPDPEEVTENAWGERGRGRHSDWSKFSDADDSYVFACPRAHSAYNRLCLTRYTRLLDDYDGAVIENVRYPTPSIRLESVLSCFCPRCRTEDARAEEWRRRVLDMRKNFESATDADLEKWETLEGMLSAFGLDGLMRSRESAIYDLARRYSEVTRKAGKEFALVLLSPALTLFAGQDYSRLTELADWVRPLVLCRARCPSGFRVEIPALLKSMMLWGSGFSAKAILRFLSRSTEMELPSNYYEIEEFGLDPSTAFGEVARAKALSRCPVYPGFEFMRENPDYEVYVSNKDVTTYLKAAEDASGFFMAWNLLFVPEDYLRLANAYRR